MLGAWFFPSPIEKYLSFFENWEKEMLSINNYLIKL